MPKKIVFIGAGSVTFTRNLVRDILTFPAFSDAIISLVDISEDNLALAKTVVEKIIETGKYGATVQATTKREEALVGADGVLCTIAVGSNEVMQLDRAIPTEYGCSISVGDTRGPSGVFRYLRTINVMIDIVKDIEKYCPDAIFLNYTNPMAMICRTLQEVAPKVRTSGLCHSVQGTAEMLARWIGAEMEDVDFVCAGINHQAFYLDYKWKGKDAYPLLREAVAKPDIYNEELVRNEMFIHLGYYVTESSHHNSEYNAWFRKRPDLLEKYCKRSPSRMANFARFASMSREERRLQAFKTWMEGEIDLTRGHEYAAYIFNAVFGDQTFFEFNGNVRNWSLIDNLPEGCCVEVPVLANKRGLSPMHVGKLPQQLSTLIGTNANCEELAVQGSLEGDPRKIFHACLYDPLTAAICSMQEIQDMVTKMFEAQKDWLVQFKHFS
ncbi:MAG: alpha-galactosidase [Oscillospiraceae bacterium]|nr:alpha-galactosidase [Oscillospiraceae bacterium]